MKKLIFLLVTFLSAALLLSCDLLSDTYTVTLRFDTYSSWETALGRELWYRVVYLTGTNRLEEVYIPSDTDDLTITIDKGSPCLAAAYPLGYAAPLGICLDAEEAGDEVSLCYADGETASRILEFHSQFQDLYDEIDLSDLSRQIWEGTGGEPYRADWGLLYYQLQMFEGEDLEIVPHQLFPVTIADVPEGYWVCDQRGVGGRSVRDGGGPLYLSLPEGDYAFLNPEDCLYILQLHISSDGQCVSSWAYSTDTRFVKR